MNNEKLQNQRHSSGGANTEPVVRALQLVRAGSSEFGIFTEEIATIVAWREPTPLPHASGAVLGVVSIQGRMLTVLNLATLHDGEPASNDATAQHLVALRGDEQLALAVEALGEIAQLAPGDLPDFAARETAGTLVLGVMHRAAGDVKILNPKELFPTAIQGRERRRRRF